MLLYIAMVTAEVIRVGVFTEIWATPDDQTVELGSEPVYSHPTTACVAAANLAATVRALRDAYTGDASLEFTKIVLTNKDEGMPPNMQAVLESLDLQVRDVPQAHRIVKMVSSRRFAKMRTIQMLCVHIVRFVEFDVVAFIDLDYFMLGAQTDIIDLMRSRNFIAQPGAESPVNAGFFAFQPSKALADRMDQALEHGYDHTTFWGGTDTYPAWVLKLRDDWAEKLHRRPWSWNCAEGDQGMLIHLAAHAELDTNPIARDYVKAHHLTGPGSHPKPWYPAKLFDDCFAASANNHTNRHKAATDCLGKDRLRRQIDFWYDWFNMTTAKEPEPFCHLLMDNEYQMRRFVFGV